MREGHLEVCCVVDVGTDAAAVGAAAAAAVLLLKAGILRDWEVR